MEKILVKRLHHYLESENRLDQYQCDFCPAKSTLDNRLYLLKEINLGFHRKQHLTLIFFDVEKVFDCLLPTTVLKAMQNLGFTGNILSFICNFLQQRTFQVRIGQKISTARFQQTDTSRGSILSPVLFILALNSIIEIIPRTTQYLLLTDARVIFLKRNNPDMVIRRLQNIINYLSQWKAERG